MQPKEFDGQNVVFAKDQPQYNPLPARIIGDDVVSCWELTDDEIERIKETRCIWVASKTFQKPLQPLYLTVHQQDLFT